MSGVSVSSVYLQPYITSWTNDTSRPS